MDRKPKSGSYEILDLKIQKMGLRQEEYTVLKDSPLLTVLLYRLI